MARASRGKFENVNEQAFVGITGVVSQHPLVDILLRAFALIARRKKSARRIWCQTCFKAGGLGVVMRVVDNHPPVSVDVASTLGHSVEDFGRAQVTFGADPVGRIIRTRSLGGSRVIRVIERVLLVFVQVLHQVIGGLVSDIGVFFVKNVIFRYGVLNFIFGVVGVF